MLKPMMRRVTLVELLVATVLGTILVGVATFVWMQSSDIFSTTVNRLETYQRMRTVLDVMERDLANTNRTVDMEFYTDTVDPPNGHFDKGVDTPFNHPPGSDFRATRDANDPLNGQPEFAVPGILNDAGQQRYFYAPVIFSPEPYLITEDGYTSARAYWRDEIYVRSFASVQGVNRPALVHYRLVQPVPGGRSLLRRRIWFLDTDGTLKDPNVTTGDPGTDQVAILSHGIADLKVGFFFKASASQTGSVSLGSWYHVGPISGGYSDPLATDLLTQDTDRGFVATNDATQGLSRQHVGTGQFAGLNACSFVYDGNARLELPEVGPVTMRTLDRTVTDISTLKLQGATDLAHYSNFDWPGVRPGAKVYISDATDDDDVYVNNQTAGSFFESRVLTVDSIVADSRYQTFVGMIFKEPINFQRLFSTWLGKETVFPITNAQVDPVGGGAYPKAGPERKIAASFNVKYRVGFLPAAFMIRLSADDRNNKKILPMERVIRLLQQ